MLLKCILVLLAISSVPTRTEAQILDNLSEWNDLLKRVLEVYNNLQESGDINLADVIGELATVEQLTNALVFFLDNFSDQLPQEGVCLIRFVIASDKETQEKVRELVSEAVHYYQLTRERDELTVECESYDPGSLSGLINQQNCRAKLQYVELQISNSNAKLRLQVLALREEMSEGIACLSKKN